MSSTKVVHPPMGLMGARSTPTIVELIGMYFAATWSQPSGAAHRSMHALAPLKKSSAVELDELEGAPRGCGSPAPSRGSRTCLRTGSTRGGGEGGERGGLSGSAEGTTTMAAVATGAPHGAPRGGGGAANAPRRCFPPWLSSPSRRREEASPGHARAPRGMHAPRPRRAAPPTRRHNKGENCGARPARQNLVGAERLMSPV